MFNFELQPARERLADAIRFSRKGGGYFYPDDLTDRNAISLTKITYSPTKEWDEVVKQFANVAWVMNL